MQEPNTDTKQKRRVLFVSVRIRLMIVFGILYSLTYFVLFDIVHRLASSIVTDVIATTIPANVSLETASKIAASVIAQVQAAEVPVFGVSLLTLIVVLFFASYGITRPLRALTRYAERVAVGDYTPAKIPKIPFLNDEISTLSEVFEMMVSNVREREQSLKARVKELEINIDEVRKAQQVKEIVDSEFFNNLKDQVRDLKERKRPSSNATGQDATSGEVQG